MASNAPTAHAQQSGPIRLAPLPPPESAPGGTGAQPAVTPADPALSPGGVLIRGLDALAEDAVGVLGASNGGLGADMWAGTDHTTAVRLLTTLPSRYLAGEARELTRRLLLSSATPPDGGGSVADSGKPGLLAARVAGLVSIGAPADAIELARAAHSRRVPDHLARSIVSANFLRSDLETGCDVLDQYKGGYAEPFWQKALILCQIVGGKGAEASLGLDLLREERGDTDGVFQNIAYATAVGAQLAPEQLETPGATDVLTFAMLTVAEAELPDWMLASNDPALVRAMLVSPQVDPARKLALAHRALRRGVVDADDVVAVYDGLGASDEAIAAALLDPDSVDRDIWLAYLYLAARNQTVAIARSEALWEAWTLAQAAEVDDIVMTTTAALLADVPATSGFGWLAAAATRAALLAGEDDLAIEWYQLVVRQARSVADMARATALMWPEMRIIGRNLPAAPEPENIAAPAQFGVPDPAALATITAVTGTQIPAPGRLDPQLTRRSRAPVSPLPPVPWSPTRLSRWIDLAGNNEGTADIGLALYMLQILGDPVSEENWRSAPVTVDDTTQIGGPVPSPAALAGLARAAIAKRRAEVTLYAMIVLGQAGETPHAGVVANVVRGLQRVGLDTDAQAIARAALVARVR
ncbi:MAG: hypothetical protein HOL07_02210 [Rhodospirillaceae bacterium]|nr:hypothetical protein [Rhodospirillaceae bacterium]MBT4771289.1 hypothetical protein [Rhodospirillaceae bacterium]MBT5357133.1 hypothetical protein [Rhodospirillaceae bacterium]MBT5769166.1 hypothetical protein [Rhodospirillaceae bacterium]MBT6308763.1 hypothetical protein [Rhodospirillaceae bacterium]